MELFERFLQERVYLRNISPATARYYRSCWTALGSHIDLLNVKNSLLARVCTLKDTGLQPGSINDYLRGCKAFLNWCCEEGHLKEKPKIVMLRTEKKILATLSSEQVERIMQWKPTGRNLTRAHTACLTILDTGLRISECLNLSRPDLDFDNLVIRVKGKGNKHRLVPMSIELRKLLFRYCGKHNHQLVFSTRNGTRVTIRNFQRDLGTMGKRLGITGVRFSPYTLRHTMAVSYLRHGGVSIR